MQKQDLIEVIKKFAALKENRRSDLDASVIWDFVASDVSSLAIFKSSPFSQQDLDEAMAEVDAESERSDLDDLRGAIALQERNVAIEQKVLHNMRLRLNSIKRGPVMSRKLRAPRDASRNFS